MRRVRRIEVVFIFPWLFFLVVVVDLFVRLIGWLVGCLLVEVR